jgi:DNA-binding Xre family transcriptional regulator
MRIRKTADKPNPHRGSSLDDFLREEGILEEVELAALKHTLALKLSDLMIKRHLSKSDMARRMGTSRAALDRLLDPDSTAVTLNTLSRAANALGRRVKVEFVAA